MTSTYKLCLYKYGVSVSPQGGSVNIPDGFTVTEDLTSVIKIQTPEGVILWFQGTNNDVRCTQRTPNKSNRSYVTDENFKTARRIASRRILHPNQGSNTSRTWTDATGLSGTGGS